MIPRLRNRPQGMTLVEVVVAMALTAVIAVVMLRLLGGANAIYSQADRKATETRRERIAHGALMAQVRAIRPWLPARAGAPPTRGALWFDGDSQRIRFLSGAPIEPGPGGGLRAVHWEVRRNAEGRFDLLVEEEQVMRPGGGEPVVAPGDWPQAPALKRYPLGERRWLQDMTELRFAYLTHDLEGEAMRELAEWDVVMQNRLPHAIRIEAVDVYGRDQGWTVALNSTLREMR